MKERVINNYRKVKDFFDRNKELKMIYLVAFITCGYSFVLIGYNVLFDTYSYRNAINSLLHLELDSFRTPVYPLFMLMTYKVQLTIISQYIIFFISIPFLFLTLKQLIASPLLVFTGLLIYVVHPAFIVYHNFLITESLSISLSTIYVYVLVRCLKYSRKRDYCQLHILMIILIFLKPAFLFLLAITGCLFLYLFIVRHNTYTLKVHFISIIFSLLAIGSYTFMMKKEYGVSAVSSVTDINLYWMCRENDLINVSSIENKNIKRRVEQYVDTVYPTQGVSPYYIEACSLIDDYGWKELHSIVQNSLKENYTSFLYGEKIFKKRMTALSDTVGLDITAFPRYVRFSFYELLAVLCLYLYIIIVFSIKHHKFTIISFIFFSYTFLNLFTLFLTAPGNYGRLIIPSLTVILLMIMQIADWVIFLIRRKPEKFELC